MIVGAAADQPEPVLFHALCQTFGITYDLFLVLPERRLQRFLETNRFGRDHMHEGAALNTGKGLRIDIFGVLFLAQDQTTTRAAQSFMSRAGNKISMADGTGMQSGS